MWICLGYCCGNLDSFISVNLKPPSPLSSSTFTALGISAQPKTGLVTAIDRHAGLIAPSSSPWLRNEYSAKLGFRDSREFRTAASDCYEGRCSFKCTRKAVSLRLEAFVRWKRGMWAWRSCYLSVSIAFFWDSLDSKLNDWGYRLYCTCI